MNKIIKPLILTLTICTGFCINGDFINQSPNSIPFIGMEAKYSFDIISSGWTIPGGGFLYLKYMDFNESQVFANVSFRLFLDPFTGTENASIVENIETRDIEVNTTGTRYVEDAFSLLFNPNENATNFTPIWVFPENLESGNSIMVGGFPFEVQTSYTIETVGKKINTWKLHYEGLREVFRNYTALFESETGLLINGEFMISDGSSTYTGLLRLEETNVEFKQISFLRRNLRYILPITFGLVGITIYLLYTNRSRVEIEGGLDKD